MTDVAAQKTISIPGTELADIKAGRISGKIGSLDDTRRFWIENAFKAAYSYVRSLDNAGGDVKLCEINKKNMSCKMQFFKRIVNFTGNTSSPTWSLEPIDEPLTWGFVKELNIVNDIYNPVPFGNLLYSVSGKFHDPFKMDLKMGQIYLFIQIENVDESPSLPNFYHLFKVLKITPESKNGGYVDVNYELQSCLADVFNDNIPFGFSFIKASSESTEDEDTKKITISRKDTLQNIVLNQLGDLKRMQEVIALNEGLSLTATSVLEIGTELVIPTTPGGTLGTMQKDMIGRLIYDLYFYDPNPKSSGKQTGYKLNSQLHDWTPSTYPFCSIVSTLTRNNGEFLLDALARYTQNVIFFSFYNSTSGVTATGDMNYSIYNVITVASLQSLYSILQSPESNWSWNLFCLYGLDQPPTDTLVAKDLEYLTELSIEDVTILSRPAMLYDTTFLTMKNNANNFVSRTLITPLAQTGDFGIASALDMYDGGENRRLMDQFLRLSVVKFATQGLLSRDVGQPVWIKKPSTGEVDTRYVGLYDKPLLITRILHHFTRTTYNQEIYATDAGGVPADAVGKTTTVTDTASGATTNTATNA